MDTEIDALITKELKKNGTWGAVLVEPNGAGFVVQTGELDECGHFKRDDNESVLHVDTMMAASAVVAQRAENFEHEPSVLYVDGTSIRVLDWLRPRSETYSCPSACGLSFTSAR